MNRVPKDNKDEVNDEEEDVSQMVKELDNIVYLSPRHKIDTTYHQKGQTSKI